jgi:hypothetical protein
VLPCLRGDGFKENDAQENVLKENVLPGKAMASENVVPMIARWTMSVVELEFTMSVVRCFADSPDVGLEVTRYFLAKPASWLRD